MYYCERGRILAAVMVTDTRRGSSSKVSSTPVHISSDLVASCLQDIVNVLFSQTMMEVLPQGHAAVFIEHLYR